LNIPKRKEQAVIFTQCVAWFLYFIVFASMSISISGNALRRSDVINGLSFSNLGQDVCLNALMLFNIEQYFDLGFALV
jgi:hypothetical protein